MERRRNHLLNQHRPPTGQSINQHMKPKTIATGIILGVFAVLATLYIRAK